MTRIDKDSFEHKQTDSEQVFAMGNGVSRFEFNPAAGMQPSGFTPADAFTSQDKSEKNHFYHAADDESVLAGVWECAKCREEISAYPVHEMTVSYTHLTLPTICSV